MGKRGVLKYNHPDRSVFTIKYAGISLTPRPICNGIYQEGWREIVAQGYDDPIKQDNNGVHHIVAQTNSRRHLGVISWYIDDAYKVPQVVVMLAYVRPGSRKKGIFKMLHSALVEKCKAEGWGAINYTVNKHNRAMRKSQDSLLSATANIEFQIYQHRIDL